MPKKIPDFQNQKEEDEFWKTHDVRDYINWDNADSFVNRVFKNKKIKDAIIKDMEKKT